MHGLEDGGALGVGAGGIFQNANAGVEARERRAHIVRNLAADAAHSDQDALLVCEFGSHAVVTNCHTRPFHVNRKRAQGLGPESIFSRV